MKLIFNKNVSNNYIGIFESLINLPNLSNLNNYANIVVLGGSGFIGYWILKTVINLKTINTNAKYKIWGVSDYYNKTQLDDTNTNVNWINHIEAINKRWNANTIVISAIGSSISWNEQSFNDKCSQYSKIIEWAKKSSKENFKLAFISSGICAPILNNISEESYNYEYSLEFDNIQKSSYFETRLAWENIVKQCNNSVIIRIFSLLGNNIPIRNQWACWYIANDLHNNRKPHIVDPNVIRPWLHPADVASWIVWISFEESGLFNLASPRSYTINQLHDAMIQRWFNQENVSHTPITSNINISKSTKVLLSQVWDFDFMVNSFCEYAKYLLNEKVNS